MYVPQILKTKFFQSKRSIWAVSVCLYVCLSVNSVSWFLVMSGEVTMVLKVVPHGLNRWTGALQKIRVHPCVVVCWCVVLYKANRREKWGIEKKCMSDFLGVCGEVTMCLKVGHHGQKRRSEAKEKIRVHPCLVMCWCNVVYKANMGYWEKIKEKRPKTEFFCRISWVYRFSYASNWLAGLLGCIFQVDDHAGMPESEKIAFFGKKVNF